MLQIGVQTQRIVLDHDPAEGFSMLKRAGFSCVDFSLNSYLINKTLYRFERNTFFDRSVGELEEYFTPHKDAAKAAGIAIHQMHMPYPLYVPGDKVGINDYLANTVSKKSMQLCGFLDCPNIVIHGFKLAHFLGSEEAEWKKTEEFLHTLAPMAGELGITMCVENLYNSVGTKIVEGPCCVAEKAAERIDRFNRQYGAEVLGFCFDTGHANLVGLDFEQFITTLGNRLKVLHIHDNDCVADLHQLPFTFTKTRENTPSTDWDGFIRALQAVEFRGALSFETAPVLTTFPDEMKEDVLRFIARIGRYFAEQISA